jgi:glycine betaine/proline transport system substrate-binding protein
MFGRFYRLVAQAVACRAMRLTDSPRRGAAGPRTASREDIMKKILGAIATVALLSGPGALAPAAAAAKCPIDRTVKFGGLDWASNSFHVGVARFILEKGYGCRTDAIPTTTAPSLNGLAKGDLDIIMEIWYANNVELWDKMMATGRVMEPGGVSIQGAVQAWWVPRYVVDGDAKRGIKPMAPGLKSVSDLPKYKALFKDPEEPSKGRFYNCKLGWNCERVNSKKLEAYGLLKDYTNFKPGSGAALAAAIASSYKRGRPIVFYYWGPTWVLGKYDLVELKEPAYNKADWDKLDKAKSGKGLTAVAYPKIKVIVGANKAFAKKAPAIIRFLSHYNMPDKLTNQALVYMREHRDKTGRKAAMDFLRKHPEIWTKWLPADVAARVKAALS